MERGDTAETGEGDGPLLENIRGSSSGTAPGAAVATPSSLVPGAPVVASSEAGRESSAIIKLKGMWHGCKGRGQL